MSKIQLKPKVSTAIKNIRQEILGLEKQIQEKNNLLSNLITGICLQEDLDLSKISLNLNDECTELTVTEIPQNETEKTEEKPSKAKRAKL